MFVFALCFRMRFDFPSGTSALRILRFAIPDQIEHREPIRTSLNQLELLTGAIS